MKKKNEKVNVELFRWMPLENLLVMHMFPLIYQFYLAGTSKLWVFFTETKLGDFVLFITCC